MSKYICTIPFEGFYRSNHNDLLDQGFEDSGLEFDDIHWGMTHLKYASLYASQLAELLGIELKFDRLQSPREYNFETDRIFCLISEADAILCMFWAGVTTMNDVATERHTSYDGFHSFYDPDWTTWGELSEWEPEQLHTLILAALRGYHQWEGDERELMEEACSNGHVEQCLTTNEELKNG